MDIASKKIQFMNCLNVPVIAAASSLQISIKLENVNLDKVYRKATYKPTLQRRTVMLTMNCDINI